MMALTPINLGSAPNDGKGDNLRTAGQKINENFAVVEAALGTIPTGIEGAGARSFTNVDALLANTQMTYRSNQVVAGSIVRTLAEGFAYRVAPSGASDHHVTTASGVKLYVLPGANGFNVRAFGAKGDGKTDDTAAFNAVICANPAWGGSNNITSLGRAMIHVPRGRYLCNGTIQTGNNAGGIILKGEGPRVSMIVRTNNTGSLLRFRTYSYVELSNLAFIHDTASPKSEWANTVIELDGTSGGQQFLMDSCYFYGFNRVIEHKIGVNEDTNYVRRCWFRNSKTVVYARNSQAVINKWEQCTFSGNMDRAFDVAGYGYTHIDTANVVIPGTFLYFAGAVGGPSNQFLITNAKLEYDTAGTIKIIEMADSLSAINYITMIGCGLTSAYPADPDTFQFDLQGTNYTLHVLGGDFQNCRIRTRGRSGMPDMNHRNWVKFENLTRSPNTTIERVGAAGTQQPPVIFQDCGGRANITITTPYGGSFRPTSGPHHPSWNTLSNEGGVVRSGTNTYSFPTYGQLVEVRSVRLLLGAKTTGTLGATMKVFTNAAKTTQIGSTITITDTAPAAYVASIPAGTFTSEGVYVEIARTGSANAHGRITCETVSV